MKKVYYEKIGRRYVPVSEYDPDIRDSLPRGDHLISVYPGGQSTRFNVNPDYASLIAAGRVAEDAICEAIRQASELRPNQTPITAGQKRAWLKLAKEFGEDLCMLKSASAREVAEAGVQAMQEEANKLMKHESVRQAYEHFLLTCELCKEHK